MSGDNAGKDFELYKLLVEEAREARRARRELSNIFTTINLAGAGFIAGALSAP